MRAIFISYRREDTEGQAGRLFDDLVAHFGKDCVFMDVAGIEPGQDFRRVIDQHLANCGVLLALIGKQWVDLKGPHGRRRLDDPLDFVRLETASALKRDIPVVPVLVQHASMPSAEQLPSDVADLAYRNGVELTHARWDSDVKWLIKALSVHVKPVKPAGVAEDRTPVESHPSRRMPLIAIAVASIVAIVLSVFSGPDSADQDTDAARETTRDVISKPLVERQSLAATAPALTSSSLTQSSNGMTRVATTVPRETACTRGYVERRAYQEDTVCVLHSSAARAAADNRNAHARWQSGAYGEKTCISGYVWRVAVPDDLVCVLPETRDETALENRQVNPKWRMQTFPPPNAGALSFTLMPDGNPACASYGDGSCLWGVAPEDLDFAKVQPLACGEVHRQLWGRTGYEDSAHWCSLAKQWSADSKKS